MYKIYISDFDYKDIEESNGQCLDDVVELLDMTFLNVVKMVYPNEKIDWSGTILHHTTRYDKETVVNNLIDIKKAVYDAWRMDKIRPEYEFKRAAQIVFNDLYC
jgi:hypothetical protein